MYEKCSLKPLDSVLVLDRICSWVMQTFWHYLTSLPLLIFSTVSTTQSPDLDWQQLRVIAVINSLTRHLKLDFQGQFARSEAVLCLAADDAATSDHIIYMPERFSHRGIHQRACRIKIHIVLNGEWEEGIVSKESPLSDQVLNSQ